VPCTGTQSTVYQGYSNISSLVDVPHARENIFSPGGALPAVTAHGNSATLLAGDQSVPEWAQTTNLSSATGWSGSSGVDPGALWQFLVCYQNFAGTTTTNQQAQIMIEYKVKWFQPVATAVQSLTERNFWGGEEVPPGKPIGEAKAVRSSEEKKFTTTSISIATADSKREPPMKKATGPSATQAGIESLLSGDDDDDEREFLEYLRNKFKARSAIRQALAFEETDFSGTRSLQSGIQ